MAKVFEFYEGIDIGIASAAVADYAPKEIAKEKIKKNDENLTIELVKNPDILKTMGEKKTHQFLVGFALKPKMKRKMPKENWKRKTWI